MAVGLVVDVGVAAAAVAAFDVVVVVFAGLASDLSEVRWWDIGSAIGALVTALCACSVAGGDNLVVTFDDNAAEPITSTSPPGGFGTYQPVEALSTIPSPQPAGDWTMILQDTQSDDVGQLYSWSLDFEASGADLHDKTPAAHH